MRLPKNEGIIDIEQTSKMVDMFLEAGFTYFDTAFVYEGSEEAAKKALIERHPRESFQLATKLAAWLSPNDAKKAKAQFETSLERSGAGYFDYYLLHNLGNERTKVFEDLELWDWVKQLKAEGKIKHFGFSFHSTADELDKILSAHPETEFVQLQINYIDWESSDVQSRACYEVCRKHGIEVIVMEPVKGGALATMPDEIGKKLKYINPNDSYASWAIRFAASLPGVGVVLSGMSNVEQMENNISFMKDFKPLSDEEQKAIATAREELLAIPLIPCTSCEYCAKVCPCNIGISQSFRAYNAYKKHNNLDYGIDREHWFVTVEAKKNSANKCIKCGKCEQACPQHIKIRDELEKIAKDFELS